MKYSATARWTVLGLWFCFVLSSVTFFSGMASGQNVGIPQLGSADSALAIDEDGPQPTSSYPGGEAPSFAINGTVAKYLNFGGVNAGFIATPQLGLPVESFQITTANDAVTRDPESWELYGFNGTLLSADNSTGMAEVWTLIDSGLLDLNQVPGVLPNGGADDFRNTLGTPVNVDLTAVGGAGFDHYKMVFPTQKNPTQGSVFQIGEIQFYDGDNATGNPIFAPGDPILAIDEDVFPDSSFPAGESPAHGIDQMSGTKYLNFGEENSGIIITNSTGPIRVDNMGLTTANDWPGRDPGSYELYGTNDPILSTSNSDGMGGEVWTLISSGGLSLPGDPQISADGRFTHVIVPINSATAYTSHKLVFPTLKDTNGPNVDSMQIADIQFYQVPEPATLALVAMGSLAVLLTSRRRNL